MENDWIDDSSCGVVRGATIEILGGSYLPILLPEAASPTASARFVLKYVERIATPGINKNPHPIPMQKACASRACQ
jgi:hypothetical protein